MHLVCAFTQLEQVVHELQCLCERIISTTDTKRLQSVKVSGIGYPAAHHVQLPHTEAKFISNTGPEHTHTHMHTPQVQKLTEVHASVAKFLGACELLLVPRELKTAGELTPHDFVDCHANS